jgi:hypothetical protein
MRLKAEEVHLAPGIPSLESLGAHAFDDFFRTPGAPGFERAKLIRSRDGIEEIRYPLPGTPKAPDESAGPRGRPMGAGTGFLILRRFTRSTLRERWRARFTHPRSTSLAEREWNLMCRAREQGVATPEPLAVGRGDGAIFAERSFLVVRELDDVLSLRQWSEASLDSRLGQRVRDSLVLALERLWSAGLWLPTLNADNILVGPPRNPDGGDPDCVARRIVEMQTGTKDPVDSATIGALKWGVLPEIVFTEFRGGSMTAQVSTRRRNKLLHELGRELESSESPRGISTA